MDRRKWGILGGVVRACGARRAELPAGSVSVQVHLSGGGTIVGPTNVDVSEGQLRSIFVVGNQGSDIGSPVVPLILDAELQECVGAPVPTVPTYGLFLTILVLLGVASRSLSGKRVGRSLLIL